jgi:hypothetical protein
MSNISNSCRKSNFIFFLKNAIFWAKRKLLDLWILDRPIMMIFFLSKKLKNIKFNFLQEFDMENKLNSLDRSFLT